MRPTDLMLGRGRLSDAVRREAQAEGPLLVEEGLSGRVTYRHFRGAGLWANWHREAVHAALLVTRHRLGVFVRTRPIVNVPFEDPRFRELVIDAGERGLRVLARDCSIFNPRVRGEQEVVLKVADPGHALAYIRAQVSLH